MVRNQSFDLQNTDNPRHIDRIFLQFLTEIINACLPLLLYHAVHELLVLAERRSLLRISGRREFNTCCT